jgi:hypothetical protein
MVLDTYRDKRNFAETLEPADGEGEPDRTLRFVVQKHQARRLHLSRPTVRKLAWAETCAAIVAVTT